MYLLSPGKSIISFSRSSDGAIGVIFALCLIPMIALLGLAVDYSVSLKEKARLVSIADAAALFAVSDTVVTQANAWDRQRDISQAAARREFMAAVEGRAQSVEVFDFNVSTSVQEDVLTVSICYRAQQLTIFGKIFYDKGFEIAACSEASSAPPLFFRIIFLVDASGSMGIGATGADQRLMRNMMNCEFACHTTGSDSYARSIGARLRFDVIQESLLSVVNSAQYLAKRPDQFEFHVYKFSNYLTPVIKSRVISQVKAAIGSMSIDSEGAGTNFRYALQQLMPNISSGGDGKTNANPKTFLIILTDGVESNVYQNQTCTDVEGINGQTVKSCQYVGDWRPDTNFVVTEPGFWSGAERSQALGTLLCSRIRDKGVVIATLNTEYLITNINEYRFMNIQNIIKPAIRETMQRCASRPDFAFFASTPAEIQSATEMLFKTLMEKARITK